MTTDRVPRKEVRDGTFPDINDGKGIVTDREDGIVKAKRAGGIVTDFPLPPVPAPSGEALAYTPGFI